MPPRRNRVPKKALKQLQRRSSKKRGGKSKRSIGVLSQVKPKGGAIKFRENPEQVIPTGKAGGWSEILRPRRLAISHWDGQPLEGREFTLVFDGFSTDDSQEEQIQKLENMAKPRESGKAPPILKLDYGRMGENKHWVISDLEYGQEHRGSQLNRVFQAITVRLVEFVDPEIQMSHVKRKKERDKDKGKGDGKGKKDGDDKDDRKNVSRHGERKRHIVKRGDTLASIAAKQLGNANEWKRIARLNDIRDPNRIKPGQKISIPKD